MHFSKELIILLAYHQIISSTARNIWILWHCWISLCLRSFRMDAHDNACIATLWLMGWGKESQKNLFISSNCSQCMMLDVKSLILLPNSQDHIMIYSDSIGARTAFWKWSCSRRFANNLYKYNLVFWNKVFVSFQEILTLICKLCKTIWLLNLVC